MTTRKTNDAKKTNAKKTNVEHATIVLKTLHNDIMRDNANATMDCKKMRVWLRANMRDIHDHNSSWIFTQSQYDIVRSHFDATYRAKIERANKRNSRVTKTRVTKKTNDATNDVTTNDVIVNVE